MISLNMLFNSVAASSVAAVLATEGYKCVSSLFGKPLKGKKAFWTFVIIFAAMTVFPYDAVKDYWYAIQTAGCFLGGIGVYSFVSRLFDALHQTSNNKR